MVIDAGRDVINKEMQCILSHMFQLGQEHRAAKEWNQSLPVVGQIRKG